jgi:hypothetical protein
MSSSFAEIVEGIKALSTSEKQELHELIEKYLIEERREDIHQSYIRSQSELEDNQAEFTSDTDRLKEMLLND